MPSASAIPPLITLSRVSDQISVVFRFGHLFEQLRERPSAASDEHSITQSRHRPPPTPAPSHAPDAPIQRTGRKRNEATAARISPGAAATSYVVESHDDTTRQRQTDDTYKKSEGDGQSLRCPSRATCQPVPQSNRTPNSTKIIATGIIAFVSLYNGYEKCLKRRDEKSDATQCCSFCSQHLGAV